MRNATTLSVVIPTCDRPCLLERALASVEGQNWRPDEVIVVDNSLEAVELSADYDRLTLIRLPPRCGVSRARNAGAERARGDHVAFLDDDDEWHSDYLRTMVKEIRREPADFYYGRRIIIKDGKRTERPLYAFESLLDRSLIAHCGIGGQNLVVRRSAFLEVGGFDTDLQAAEDAALVLDLLLAGKVGVPVPEAVAFLHRGRADHLTDPRTLLQGQWSFARKYLRHMRARHAVAMAGRLCKTRAKVFDDGSGWSKMHKKCSKFLMRLSKMLPG